MGQPVEPVDPINQSINQLVKHGAHCAVNRLIKSCAGRPLESCSALGARAPPPETLPTLAHGRPIPSFAVRNRRDRRRDWPRLLPSQQGPSQIPDRGGAVAPFSRIDWLFTRGRIPCDPIKLRPPRTTYRSIHRSIDRSTHPSHPIPIDPTDAQPRATMDGIVVSGLRAAIASHVIQKYVGRDLSSLADPLFPLTDRPIHPLDRCRLREEQEGEQAAALGWGTVQTYLATARAVLYDGASSQSRNRSIGRCLRSPPDPSSHHSRGPPRARRCRRPAAPLAPHRRRRAAGAGTGLGAHGPPVPQPPGRGAGGYVRACVS